MRLLHIHNYYRFRGGEDVMFERIGNILRSKGHAVTTFERRSGEIAGPMAKFRAFVSGAYSREAKREIQRALRDESPDVVHVHNLYPLISPSAIEACVEESIPVVMRCPNYRLECPTGVLMRHGKVCTRCSGGREYNCALSNCRGSVLESVAFAARSVRVRWGGIFKNGVSVFVPPSEFVKSRLVAAGYPAGRIRVIPNVVPLPSISAHFPGGQYVAFAGRFSEEKGIETLLKAAERLPGVPFRIAGEGPLGRVLKSLAPSNVTFVGQLSRTSLGQFYTHARICAVPSRWYEAFGLVAAEAMSYGVPVIATKMAGLAEIVDDGKTGFHVPADDDAALAARVELLWNNPDLCTAMGAAGREKVRREYSENMYYTRLMGVYAQALDTRPAPIPAGKLAESA